MGFEDIHYAKVRWHDDQVPRSAHFDDVYYSVQSGLEESKTVFLDAIDAPRIWQHRSQFAIAETGFGTGLNFLVTWQAWEKQGPKIGWLDYFSVERFPLHPSDLRRALSAWPSLAPYAKELLAKYPPPSPGFHLVIFPKARIRLCLMFGEATHMLSKLNGNIDAWFLDGFAPSKNTDMWSDGLFQQIARLSNPGARAATFSAAGIVKRGLASAGFSIQKLPGFDRKRERITGIKDGIAGPVKRPQSIAIIGGGIAGCCAALSLQRRGYDVHIYDRNDHLLSEASGNPAALINPKLILGNDPYGRLFTNSYSAALRFYDGLPESPWLSPRGTLKIATTVEDARFHDRLLAKFGWPQDALIKLSENELANLGLAGQKHGALFFPQAGALETAKLRAYFESILPFSQRKIAADDKLDADVVIHAGGFDTYRLLPDHQNPISPNRGQIAIVGDTLPPSLGSVSFGKYLSAPMPHSEHGAVRILGASHSMEDTPNFRADPAEDIDLLSALNDLTGATPAVKDRRVGYRANIFDHLPVVGPIPIPNEIKNRVPKGRAIRADDLNDSCFDKMRYLLTGFGSRGFQTAPYVAEVLAAMIDKTPVGADQSLLDALSPARFQLKQLKR